MPPAKITECSPEEIEMILNNPEETEFIKNYAESSKMDQFITVHRMQDDSAVILIHSKILLGKPLGFNINSNDGSFINLVVQLFVKSISEMLLTQEVSAIDRHCKELLLKRVLSNCDLMMEGLQAPEIVKEKHPGYFAFDIDGVLSKYPLLIRDMMTLVASYGCFPFIVTGRKAWSDDLLRLGIDNNTRVFYCGDTPKRQFLEQKGIVIDVWIDGQPWLINGPLNLDHV